MQNQKPETIYHKLETRYQQLDRRSQKPDNIDHKLEIRNQESETRDQKLGISRLGTETRLGEREGLCNTALRGNTCAMSNIWLFFNCR